MSKLYENGMPKVDAYVGGEGHERKHSDKLFEMKWNEWSTFGKQTVGLTK